jgi:NAD+ synthase (glutamine-hydrolysing)
MAELLATDLTDDILCDIGMPVFHQNVRYNCRVYVLNRRILFIKPKIFLADDGNYREPRWFTGWKRPFELEDYWLPGVIRRQTGQETVPIGDGALALLDTAVSSETCEELFTPRSPHIEMGLNGIEILGNGSASHGELGKLHKRVSLIQSASQKSGGVYVYANHQGCDGGRLYFDGSCMIFVNGQLVAQGSQFSLKDVEVVTANIDLRDVRSYRGAIASRSNQAAASHRVPRVKVEFALCSATRLRVSPSFEPRYLERVEEIAYGTASWLWDYLRRSGMSGYFLPLSGGADSASVLTMVGIMCELVVQDLHKGNKDVKRDLLRLLRQDSWEGTHHELCGRLLFTTYMASKNSSQETRQRAQAIAKEVGSTHNEANIDDITAAFHSSFVKVADKEPKFRAQGGSDRENLALQNIQARSRMVLAYLLAQLTPWTHDRPGALLVLGAANVDECLRGYYTKYDCSSADVNPIGGISKKDLKEFLAWATTHKNYPSLLKVVHATPTAELEPSSDTYVQSDEADMGMTYAELDVFGRLRKVYRCGPLSMYDKLLDEWPHLTPNEVAEKVKRFFRYYSINRHKTTTLTPSYHVENYSPDDNRFDLRPFLYNTSWDWQFQKMDERVLRDTSLQSQQADNTNQVQSKQ